MFQSITRKLRDAFPDNSVLDVKNESSMHAVPPGSETHFKVTLVSGSFAGMGLLDRHRAVNGVLAEELKTGVHALSITAKTEQEWEKSGGTVSASPSCLGGSKKEKAMKM